jgi:hypothetical protein
MVPEDHYIVHKGSQEDCTLRQLNPVPNSTLYSSKTRFNVIIPALSSFPKRSLLLRFSEKHSACITYFLHVCYMSCISYPPPDLTAPHDSILTTLLSNLQVTKIFIRYTSPFSCYFLLSSNNAVIKKLVCHNRA